MTKKKVRFEEKKEDLFATKKKSNIPKKGNMLMTKKKARFKKRSKTKIWNLVLRSYFFSFINFHLSLLSAPRYYLSVVIIAILH